MFNRFGGLASGVQQLRHPKQNQRLRLDRRRPFEQSERMVQVAVTPLQRRRQPKGLKRVHVIEDDFVKTSKQRLQRLVLQKRGAIELPVINLERIFLEGLLQLSFQARRTPRRWRPKPKRN